MTLFKTAMVLLVAVCVGTSPISSYAKDGDKGKTTKVSELLKDANEFMSQAQTAYIDGKAREAIDLYRKALAEIARVERENEKRLASSEFAPVRFRKALCETEIDRIMLEEVNATARTVAVTDTSALELKRAERKKAAETNNVPESSVNLAAKKGVEKEEGKDVPDEAVSERKIDPSQKVDLAHEGQSTNVVKDLEWAKDLISVDRFDDAEKVLLAALKDKPDSRDARFLLALSRVQQGRVADAAVIIDDLLADNAKDEAVLLLAAGAHTAKGDYSKAMEALDKAMSVDPKRPDGYINMAWLLLEMNPKQLSEAEMYYRQAIKLGGARDRDIERRLGIKAE